MNPNNINILLVEDYDSDQQAFEHFVKSQSLDYHYTIANSVATAREFISAMFFDIIITNCQLPDGSAYDILPLAFNRPVIFTSETNKVAEAVKALKAGAYDYLVKNKSHTYLNLLAQTVQNALIDKKKEDRLSLVTAASQDALYDWDVKHNKLWLNESYSNLFGEMVKGDNVGNWWNQRVHPEDLPEILLKIANNSNSEKRRLWSGEYRYRTIKGQYLYVKDSSIIIHDDNGEVTRIAGALTDITERKETERQLRYQASLQENTWDAVIGTDLDFNIKSWNKAAERIYNWSEEEALGQSVAKLLGIKYRDDNVRKNAIVDLYEKGYWNGEVVQHRKDGSPINILGSVVLIKDKNGKALGAVAVNHDISELKWREAALQASEAELRTLFTAMDDRIVVYDREGYCIQVVPTTPDPIFFTKEELLGVNLDQIHSPTEAAYIKKLIHQALDTHQKVEVEQPLQKNGQSFWISFSVTPLTTDTCIAISRNITQRKQTEEALQKTNDQFRAILDNSNAVIFMSDINHRYLAVNQYQETILGLKREEIIGKTPAELFPEEEAKKIVANRQQVLDSRTTLEFEETCLLADGLHTFLSIKSPLLDAKGVPYGVIGVSTDITERKRWEETLRKNEAQLAEAQRIAKLGSWEINLQTGETIWSEGTLRVVGGMKEGVSSLEDFLNQFVHPEDKAYLQEQTFKTVNEGLPFETEFRILHQDGTSSNIYGRTQPHIENGKITKIFGTIQDITELKQTEEALKRSEADLRSIFDNTHLGFVLLDKEGRVRLANRVASGNILKYYHNPVVPGKTYQELIPNVEMRAQFTQHFEEALGGNPIVSELIEGFDKEINYFERHYYPVIANDGNTIGVCITTENITERRLAEQTLKENEARLQILFEYSPSPLCVWDKSGILFDTNRAYEELSGYSRQQLFGGHYSSIIPIEPKQLDKDLERILKNGQNVEYELKTVRKDGVQIIVEARVFPIKMLGEDYILASVHDITRRKEIEQELRQAVEKQKELMELKTRFISTASHEFRTPLAIIQAASDALKEYMDKMSPEQVRRRLDKIQSQIRHMVILLDDILTIERVQSTTNLYQPTYGDLSQFCHELLAELKTTVIQNHTINYMVGPNSIKTYFDRKLMRQIITNLLTNAAKFSSPDKPIKFDLSRENNQIKIQVADQGIGIPEKEQSQIFDAFHRAANVGTIQGTGLGLAITKHAVEIHGGKLIVQSQLAQGSTFIVVIPDCQSLESTSQEIK